VIALRRYPLTATLLLLNGLIYLIVALWSGSLIDMAPKVLVEVGALFGPFVVLGDEWWRLLSAMFLHGGMTHLLMNLFSLYLIGRGAESYFSRSAYLSLYLSSGVIGGLVSLLMHPVSVGVGASGAIFGLFGALAGFFLAHREQIAEHTRAFMKDFALLIGLNLVIGFAIPAVDVSAHMGGLIVGGIGGYLLSRNPKWLLPYSVVMLCVAWMLGAYSVAHYDLHALL